MLITGINVYFGDEVFSHANLCDEIGEDISNKILDKAGFNNRFITSYKTDIIEIGKVAISSTFLREKIKKADFIIVVSEYVQNLIHRHHQDYYLILYLTDNL